MQSLLPNVLTLDIRIGGRGIHSFSLWHLVQLSHFCTCRQNKLFWGVLFYICKVEEKIHLQIICYYKGYFISSSKHLAFLAFFSLKIIFSKGEDSDRRVLFAISLFSKHYRTVINANTPAQLITLLFDNMRSTPNILSTSEKLFVFF